VTVIFCRADRKLGELLHELPKNKGGRPRKNLCHDVTGLPSLEELGIGRKQSERCQRVLSVKEEAFEEHLKDLLELQAQPGPVDPVLRLRRLLKSLLRAYGFRAVSVEEVRPAAANPPHDSGSRGDVIT
jgi:hypothetical protein